MKNMMRVALSVVVTSIAGIVVSGVCQAAHGGLLPVSPKVADGNQQADSISAKPASQFRVGAASALRQSTKLARASRYGMQSTHQAVIDHVVSQSARIQQSRQHAEPSQRPVTVSRPYQTTPRQTSSAVQQSLIEQLPLPQVSSGQVATQQSPAINIQSQSFGVQQQSR